MFRPYKINENGSYFVDMNKVKERGKKEGESILSEHSGIKDVPFIIFESKYYTTGTKLVTITPNVFFLWRALYPTHCLIFLADKQVDHMDLL